VTGTKRNLVASRVFDVPVEKVWRAWTDPEQVMKWWGPDCFTSPSAEIDFREGGKSVVCMRAPASFGGQDMYSSWVYQKIVPLQSIEFVHNIADKEGATVDPAKTGLPPDFPRDQRNVVTFKSAGMGKTEMAVTQYDWTPGQMMDLAEAGWKQCLGKMAESLAERSLASA
jgi:uncharacterized protein YndB with AHSA1/START domain